jgi:hypothetical protein
MRSHQYFPRVRLHKFFTGDVEQIPQLDEKRVSGF